MRYVLALLLVVCLSGSAKALDSCLVHGILYGPDISRLDGADCYFRLSSSVTDTAAGVVIGNYEVYEVSNDTGYVAVYLVRNGNCTPDNYYEISISKGDEIMPIRYTLFIPADSDSIDFVTEGKQE